MTMNCRAIEIAERERMDMTLTAEKKAKLTHFALVAFGC